MSKTISQAEFLALTSSSLTQILKDLGVEDTRTYNVIIDVKELAKPGGGKTVCFDFDGVLHQYTSDWQGPGVIKDPPVPGAADYIRSLLKDEFKVAVYSSRSKSKAGIRSMKTWMMDNGFPVGQLEFPLEKPPAVLYIDDRGYAFDGNFPSTEFIVNFKPWNK